MLAPSPTPTEQPTRLVTEAEAICNLLMDMDVSLVARLDSEKLLFQVGNSTTNGAVDLMKIARERFDADAEFREDMIGYLGATGDYVSASPGTNAELQLATAPHALRIAAESGLRVSAAFSRDDGEMRLVFSPGDRRVAPNAHLLMTKITERFAAEAQFASDIETLTAV